MCKMARYAASLRVSQKKTKVDSDVTSDHCLDLKKHCGRRRKSFCLVNVVNTESKARKPTAKPTKIASALMQMVLDLQSIAIPATPSTNGCGKTQTDSAFFFGMCLDKQCHQMWCLLARNGLCKRLTTHRVDNLRGPTLEPPKMFGY